MNKHKSVFMSTPLSPMIIILIVFVIYMLIDLKYQMKTNDNYISLLNISRGMSPTQRPDTYRKIGFLTSRELADSIFLPLFGQPAPYRRHRWNYYTITDTHQLLSSVKLPVIYRDRNCVDEVACEEIYDGDVVRVHGYSSPFVVHVY